MNFAVAPTPAPSGFLPSPTPASNPETIETRLWLEEHQWLYQLMHSANNTAPTFRLPDLISAAVAQVFGEEHVTQRVFLFLRTQLVLRDPLTARRREQMWWPQYALLLDLQRSPHNRHPHPKFQLDQFTTACVALCRMSDESGQTILQHARRNMALRASHAILDPYD